MTEKIKSRIFEYGNDKESSWPPKFGTESKDKGGRFRFNKETQKMEPVESDYRSPQANDLFTSDDIPETQSMADGKHYTSRSALRYSYKHNKQGKKYTEIGNEKFTPREKERPPAEDDVREAIRQVKWNEAPLSEFDRHRCEIINRNLRSYNYDRRRG